MGASGGGVEERLDRLGKEKAAGGAKGNAKAKVSHS